MPKFMNFDTYDIKGCNGSNVDLQINTKKKRKQPDPVIMDSMWALTSEDSLCY